MTKIVRYLFGGRFSALLLLSLLLCTIILLVRGVWYWCTAWDTPIAWQSGTQAIAFFILFCGGGDVEYGKDAKRRCIGLACFLWGVWLILAPLPQCLPFLKQLPSAWLITAAVLLWTTDLPNDLEPEKIEAVAIRRLRFSVIFFVFGCFALFG